MAPSPEIAVILGAYNRTQYLPFALRSLAAQTLARERFEVVAIKNFRHPAIDRALEQFGALTLYDEERQLGRWLRHAIDRSNAPIVTFLDDDDEFEPERLARVVEAWREHPDLGFYRNRVRVIDGAGRPIPPERWRVHETDAELDRLGPVYVPADGKAGLVDLATRRTSATFNTSSMAIRRELLDGEVGDAFERTQLEDTFLFLAGALAPRALLLDDRRLTRFRYYGGNVTSTVRFLADAAESHRRMAELAAHRGSAEFAAWHRAQGVHYERMFTGETVMAQIAAGAPRAEVVRRTAEYLRFLARHPEERALQLEVWAVAGYGAAYALAPPLARRVAAVRPTARERRPPEAAGVSPAGPPDRAG